VKALLVPSWLGAGAEGVEEGLQHLLAVPDMCPHQPPGVWSNDHGDVPLPTLVADLVDADPAQPRQPVNRAVDVLTDRVMIAPTVRQAIRISWHTALFEVRAAGQVTWSSKKRVCPA
jgi:hypothetical protein